MDINVQKVTDKLFEPYLASSPAVAKGGFEKLGPAKMSFWQLLSKTLPEMGWKHVQHDNY